MEVALFVVSSYLYCCAVHRRKCPPMIRDKPAVGFGGCGTRYHFYGGVAEYMKQNFETDNIDILCTSGSIFAATILALNRKMTNWCERDWRRCYDYYVNRNMFMFFDTTQFQRDLWRGYLPYNAYKICSDRLHITVTRLGLYGFYEERISNYASNEDLIDAIVGTMHIPGIFRNFPTARGKYAIDGCWSNLMPKTHTKTLTVKLFGRGHIDYGNRLPFSQLLTMVHPDDTNALIREGYEIASRHHQTFINCGFIPKPT
jgi:hypothetical protein